MFLHLGHDIVVPLKEVITVINLSNGYSQLNEEFLKTAEEEGFVVQLTTDPISCIVCVNKIYLSAISVQTLQKRSLLGYSVK